MQITKTAQTDIKSSGTIPGSAVKMINLFIQNYPMTSNAADIAAAVVNLLKTNRVRFDRCFVQGKHIALVVRGSIYSFRYAK